MREDAIGQQGDATYRDTAAFNRQMAVSGEQSAQTGADTLELDRAKQLQAMTAHVTVFAVPFASLMARWGHVRAEVWAVSCLTASGRLGRVAANGV